MCILAGLPRDFDTVVAVLEISDHKLELDTVLSKLLQAEQRLGRGEKPDNRAFFTSRSSNQKHRTGTSSTGSSIKECWYCGRRGHLKADCLKRKSDEQGRRNYPRGPGPITGRGGHRSVAAMGVSAVNWDHDWVLDSGASSHITGNRDMLTNIRETDHNIPVTFANGTVSEATYMGDALLDTDTATILLRDVLYVPAAAANLFSVTTATRRDTKFHFGLTGCTIHHQGRDIGEAKRGLNGLYYIPSLRDEATALSAYSKAETAELWHRRFGHLGYNNLETLVREGMVDGINVAVSDFKAAKATVCEPCIMAKHHKAPFPTSERDSTEALELLHMDLCGPMPMPSLGGSKYLATFLDDYSKMSFVRILSSKSETTSAVREVIRLLENQTGSRVRAIRTDSGSEYVNAELAQYLRSKGIVHQTTVPDNPEQNVAAERLNRTLMERARAMINDAGLPKELWAEAVNTANYIRCRSPTANRLRTPWELFYNQKPDVSQMRTFGATAYSNVPKERRQKLDNRSIRGVMVGYAAHTKGYRILLEDHTVIISRDVIFDEGTGASKLRGQQSQFQGDDSESEHEEPEHQESEHEEPEHQEPEHQELSEEPPNSEPSASQPPTGLRRSARTPRQASEWWKQPSAAAASSSGNSGSKHGTASAMSATLLEPATYEKAMASEEAEQWQQAMDEEIASLMANGTWTLEELPPGLQAIPVKWVFKVKTAANGTVERFKARLVAKGYRQQEGIDYDEVFAPVSKYATLRTLLAAVAANNTELHQLDIKTAFLNGTIEEDIYLQQPPGYTEGPNNLACHLRRALYGLRQAPRQWHARLKQELEAIGFVESEADPGLFIYHGKEDTIYLLVYVDDILIAANSLSSIEWAKSKIMTVFEARDLGEAHMYLGMLIERDRASFSLKLSQQRMTAQLLSKHHLLDAKPKSVPLTAAIKLTKDEGQPLDKHKYGYSQLIGSLMYLAVCTRPDTWSSRSQQTVAASTTEAEYMAAAAATKEALWLRNLMNDLRQTVSTVTIWADNQGAVKLLKNPITSLRSKHIDVIYHFARERVARNLSM